MAYIWTIALVIVSNVVYHICAKSVPESADPFAALCVTYTVAALTSAGLFLLLRRGENFWHSLGKLNWASVVLGLAVVCMEVGYIYAYRAGWQVSKAATVQSAIVAAILLVVGALCFHEVITLRKLVGLAICLVGLVILNQ